MPERKLKLTWQKGVDGRAGRWRKMIRGQMFYFDGGTGKADRHAYQKAVEDFGKLKTELDAATEKSHAREYSEAIEEWEAVKDWSIKNGKEEYRIEQAEKKIKQLRKRLNGPRPRPLDPDDWFLNQFETAREIARAVNSENAPKRNGDRKKPKRRDRSGDKNFFTETSEAQRREFMREFMMFPNEKDELFWKERIESHRRQKMPEEKTIGGNVSKFFEHQAARVGIGKISAGRHDNVRRGVETFRDFVGGNTLVETIREQSLRKFYKHIQKSIAKNELSASTGRDKVASTDQFVRWLWKEGVLSDLPRNLGDHEISVSPINVEVFEIKDIKALWGSAGGRMKLFMLLALNCGMTQKDISDLKPSEVNWSAGTITRKRSKTVKKKNTPTVEYLLWPETTELLRKYRSNDRKRVLVNGIGKPLKAEEILDDGRHRKTDSIGREFRRLKENCDVRDLSFINLKKTSRSLLESNKTYQPIAELFVGRSPQTISEKHYAKPPTKWLAEATNWLRKELRIKQLFKSTSRREKTSS